VQNQQDRAAVIDIGSNTIHLLVADRSGGRVEPVYKASVRAGLGLAVAGGAPLGPERIQAAAAIVRGYADEARRYRAGDIIALGTHAVRVASDRAAFVEAVEREAGVTVLVLSSEQEAVLCVAGAALGPLPPPPFLFADIGGGSSDLAAVGAGGVERTASLPVGSGGLAARDLAGDPPAASEIDRTVAVVREHLAAFDSLGLAGGSELVVTGGAARRLRRQAGGDRRAALPAGALHDIVGRLLRAPSTGWPRPVNAERAALIRAGGIILREIAARWHVAMWRVSAFGLREGALARRARGLSIDAAVPRGPEDTGGHSPA
jgi:exopolyphosphatase/guanosine-5'-triphosphate,3'-diphosphate pyrophosphatase